MIRVKGFLKTICLPFLSVSVKAEHLNEIIKIIRRMIPVMFLV